MKGLQPLHNRNRQPRGARSGSGAARFSKRVREREEPVLVERNFYIADPRNATGAGTGDWKKRLPDSPPGRDGKFTA